MGYPFAEEQNKRVHGATSAPYLVLLTQNKSLAAGDLPFKWYQNARRVLPAASTLNNYMHIWVAYIISRPSDVHEL